MNKDEFATIVNNQFTQSKKLLIKKQAEYTPDVDVLNIFKQAGVMQGVSAEKALMGFVTKQIISVYNMVDSSKDYEMDVWDEKLTDIINYMTLLRAIIMEKKHIGIIETSNISSDIGTNYCKVNPADVDGSNIGYKTAVSPEEVCAEALFGLDSISEKKPIFPFDFIKESTIKK